METYVFDAYREAFPDSKLCFLMPDGDVTVVDFENKREYKMPLEETKDDRRKTIDEARSLV